MELNDLYALLEERRRELGLSQAEVDRRAFGKAGNASFQAIRRGASPSYDRLMALGNVLGLEFYFGPQRVVEPSVATANAILAESRATEATALQDAHNATREFNAASRAGQNKKVSTESTISRRKRGVEY